MSQVQPGTFRSTLRHSDFRRLLAGLAVSQIGDWLYNVALVVFVYGQTRSATWVGITTGMRLAPYVLLGAFGGEIADRFERRRVMVVCDLARVALMLVLAVIAQTNGPVLLAGVVAFITTAAGTPYNPSVSAMTPDLVGESDLAAANGIQSAVQNISIIIGPAIGALLLALGSPTTAFYLNAVTFGLSAVAAGSVRTSSRATDTGESRGTLERIQEGLHAITGDNAARILVGFIIATSFIYGTDTVLLVLIAKQRLGTGADGYGLLLAALGAGGLAATFLTNRLATMPRLGVILVAGLAVYTIPTALMIFVHDPAIAFGLQALRGAGTIIVDVLVVTEIQRNVAPDVVGRVFGVVFALAIGGILVGSIATPAVVAILGLSGALAFFGLLPAVLASTRLPKLAAMDQEAEDYLERLRPKIELLRTMDIFSQAPRQVLEALAASARKLMVPAGAKVVKQGDPADHFFGIIDGEAAVRIRVPHQRTAVVATLKAGDYFGEIGLIQGIPRTADVVALSELDLYRIDAEDFLSAVNDSPGSMPAVMESVTRRLSRGPRRKSSGKSATNGKA